MDFSLADIQALMRDFENSSLREFKLDMDDTHLYLNKNEAQTTPVYQTTTVDTPVTVDKTLTITAPLVGTLYLASKPGVANFKQVGDPVSVGETVAIIESMKLMTEVHSEVAGTIVAINAENETVVGYDDVLFTVQPN